MGIFKNFLLKQAMKSKLKGVPEAEQEKMLGLIEKNPDFFKKIGDEVQKRVKNGQSEMAATMVVMREHQAELQKLLK
ncbi:MAG: hypothetical protein A3C62_00160 [Candidatus Zambryskibacteria bacterium RIFCSPHIGHO2_02_FULL_39_16]|uniref:Uncharacterized protein n=1 Tax=Candidatus Zambryskibacteria bacterium RIFCSPLOWO2_02_FULL_39_14 TaxID=1802769 RepID=A0A1G2UIK2_9BACT|nr:MAG: hypothetical protein UT62_C0023G0008 [Parcubacteria group bacterium GW2011_GWC1_39_8]OHA95806.1 MAG: hypothetical protein A3C62_00160 [Candidatus Zambryskibacteria bacterium RIFCSPHIGHO2_02_FULL_39_16]OHB09265.1 MAG: hypothetical protein A3I86_00450 [Candidatus Zambryskibacteria bacterium RIFCSPLOWO2_02_FULL_39_14]